MGLLDNINFDDPKTIGLLMAAAQLMSPSQSKIGVGGQLSRGLLGGLEGYAGAKSQQAKLGEEAQQSQLRQVQIAQAQQGQADQQAQRGLAERAFAPASGYPGGMTGDDNGNPMPPNPMNPGGGGMAEYIQGMTRLNPQTGLAMQAQLAALNQKERVKVAPGETIGTYNGGKFNADYSAPDKPHFVDVGGSVIAVDPRTGQPVGQPLKKGMSPDAMATDARARERFAYDKEQGGKPQVISGPNGEVFAVDARSGTGAPVMGPDGNPLNKGGKPLTESQGTASFYVGMMSDAEKNIGGLKNFDPAKPGNQTLLAFARGDIPKIPKVMQNAAAGAPAQKYAQGMYQWTEAMLRLTTGATAPEPEVWRVAKTYFPMPLDGPQVIAQKNDARLKMQDYARIKAGHGAEQVDAAQAARPQKEDPLGIR